MYNYYTCTYIYMYSIDLYFTYMYIHLFFFLLPFLSLSLSSSLPPFLPPSLLPPPSDTVMLNPNTQDSPSIKIIFKDYAPNKYIAFPKLDVVLEVAAKEMEKVSIVYNNYMYIP